MDYLDSCKQVADKELIDLFNGLLTPSLFWASMNNVKPSWFVAISILLLVAGLLLGYGYGAKDDLACWTGYGLLLTVSLLGSEHYLRETRQTKYTYTQLEELWKDEI